ncbi:hypothetical protein FOZ61_009313 [Perkinsus olseni]|uniref:Uncharacterized protein n=1 Tax=Perkinsus olseni TaxID=32597 RepID=A0A7J6MPF8_PEROL|nr:hypothetical protein FOZ61_009313 [Perkinsus olseni]KAF4673197.1 hypothetical protein FOL46_007690 [Perkinsus olseni]
MKTPYDVALATLSLWASLPAASAVRASAADSGSLKAKYNITKMTHGNSCIAVGPQFAWQFELLKGTLRTLSLHCPDSEFHMVTDPPGYAQGDSDLDIVTDPREYVQKAASIERLGIEYETTDFYNGSTGSLTVSKLEDQKCRISQADFHWLYYIADNHVYTNALSCTDENHRDFHFEFNADHRLIIARADDDRSIEDSRLKDPLFPTRVYANPPRSDYGCWSAAENVYDDVVESEGVDTGIYFTTRLCSIYRREIFKEKSTRKRDSFVYPLFPSIV